MTCSRTSSRGDLRVLVFRVEVDLLVDVSVDVFFDEDDVFDEEVSVSSSSSSSLAVVVGELSVVGVAVVLVAGKSITGSANRASSSADAAQPASATVAITATRRDWVRLRFTSLFLSGSLTSG
ncbi:hypothetical protein CIMIT_09345 [Corynebacterium imitans]|uniref:Uncharacterized protein n=1 Tax=Corynebacterium imitans TaxID=156978 RepID=A0A076NL45_9CORY|nr:hypothetical protein CIMIT_09345 [Corynebacterium imitans]